MNALLIIALALASPDYDLSYKGGLPYSGGTMTGDINLNGNKLTLDADFNSYIYASADNVVDFYVNNALALKLNTSGLVVSGNIYIGGSTAAYPMLKRSGTQILARTGDDAGAASVTALYFGSGIYGARVLNWGAGSPEGSYSAGIGSIYAQVDGSSGSTLYTKVSGTGNTGWQAVGGGTIASASPTQPYACGATTVGPQLWYVNDTDDSAPAEICVCAGITDDSTYDWVQAKDMTTACSFF